MNFSQKYELIEPLPGQGTKSFRARQIGTGREVAVHLLAGGKTPQNEALLSRLRALQPASLSKLLEVGDHEGTAFVAVAAPPFLALDEWLRQEEGVARAPGEFTRMFAAAPPAPSKEPGEFTRMFQVTPKPERVAPAALPPVDLSTTATIQMPAPAASGTIEAGPSPGELGGTFRGTFRTMAAVPKPEPAMPAAPPPPSLPPASARLHAAPSSPPPAFAAPPPAAPSTPSPQGPGEFTRMFQSPMVERQAQTEWPQPPQPAPPGEFTQFFRTPQSTQPAPPPAQAPPAQFPSVYSPQPAPAPPPANALPSFGSSYGAPHAGSNATGVFSTPSAPSAPPAPPSAPPGPSEFTMVISPTSKAPAPQAPVTPPSPAGGASPIQLQMQMPQPVLPTPQMPSVQAPSVQTPYAQVQGPYLSVPQPQIPQAQMSLPSATAPASGNWILYAIIALVSFLLGMGTAMLIVKH